jgi:hypothetical protein
MILFLLVLLLLSLELCSSFISSSSLLSSSLYNKIIYNNNIKLYGTIQNILTAEELEAITTNNTKDEPVIIDFQVNQIIFNHYLIIYNINIILKRNQNVNHV